MTGRSWWIIGGSPRKRETADEWGSCFGSVPVRSDHIDDFEGLIISSVVPPVLDMLQAMAEKYFHVRPLLVGPDIDTGIVVAYENPA